MGQAAEDFTPVISSASKAIVARRSELEAAAGVPRADCTSRLYPSADEPRASRESRLNAWAGEGSGAEEGASQRVEGGAM